MTPSDCATGSPFFMKATSLRTEAPPTLGVRIETWKTHSSSSLTNSESTRHRLQERAARDRARPAHIDGDRACSPGYASRIDSHLASVDQDRDADVHDWVQRPDPVRAGPVSYTHLTLPTIYSV